MDYLALAEQLVTLQSSLQHIPASQKLSALDHGVFFAMNYLAMHENSAYPKELSRGMAVSSARVAAMLNHLEQQGLIRRSPDPRDSRHVMVSLTEQGLALIRQKREEILCLAAKTLQELGPEDAQALLRIQKKLVEAFSRRAAEAAGKPEKGKEEPELC